MCVVQITPIWLQLRSQTFHKSSQLFPIGECHQLVQDFLQPLKPTLVISCRARYLFFAAMQVQAIRFTDLRYFVSQLRDAFLKGDST